MNHMTKAEIQAFVEKMNSQLEVVDKLLIGRKVRIISNYNDQMMGKSKPSLKGKVETISHVIFWSNHLLFKLQKRRNYIRIHEFQFVSEEPEETAPESQEKPPANTVLAELAQW